MKSECVVSLCQHLTQKGLLVPPPSGWVDLGRSFNPVRICTLSVKVALVHLSLSPQGLLHNPDSGLVHIAPTGGRETVDQPDSLSVGFLDPAKVPDDVARVRGRPHPSQEVGGVEDGHRANGDVLNS